MVLERRKKSLPGRESFNCSFKREAGAAKAQNESSLGGSTIYSATGGAENPPSMSTGHVVLVFLGASLSLAPGGCVGILEFPHAERGRALELARWMWAQVPAVPLA